MKKAMAIKTVAGKAEPTPRGAIAKPKIIPPMQAIFTQFLFKSNPIKIKNCPIAIEKTKAVICLEKKPRIKRLFIGRASNLAYVR
jgi:hypothetical protein